MTRILTIALASCAMIVATRGVYAHGGGQHGPHGGGFADATQATSNHNSGFGSGYSYSHHRMQPIVPTHRSPVLNGNISQLPVHGSPPLGGVGRTVNIVHDHRDCSSTRWRTSCTVFNSRNPYYNGQGGLSFGEKPAHFSGYLPQGGRVRDHRH